YDAPRDHQASCRGDLAPPSCIPRPRARRDSPRGAPAGLSCSYALPIVVRNAGVGPRLPRLLALLAFGLPRQPLPLPPRHRILGGEKSAVEVQHAPAVAVLIRPGSELG